MTHSNLDRRQFIRLNAAALAGTTLASSVANGTEPLPGERAGAARHNPPPGFFRFALGDLEITVVSDGFFHLSEITPDEMEPLETLAVNEDEESRQEYFRSRLIHTNVRLPICPVLIDSNDQRVLVDSGWSGGSPTAGRLGSSLELLGVAPESIDVVILTHGHPDHVGGLLHPVTNAPIYSNAEVVVAQAEFDFWTGGDARPILANPLLAGIPGILGALDERLRLIEAGDEAANGIWSVSSPGHTPGHICLVVEAGGRELLLTGDAIVNIHTCFEHPDWHKFFDFERERAARTRRRLLDRAANDEMLILGYHFPFPGLGYALRAGDAYRWYSAGSTMLP